MRSIIETGRPIVITVETPDGKRAKLIGFWVRSITPASPAVSPTN